MKKKIFSKMCVTILIFFSALYLLYAQKAQPGQVSRSSPMGPTELIIFFLILLFFVAIGLTIIASGQVFLAIRETALNTRKEKSEETRLYKVLLVVAKINSFIGWLIIIFGFIGAWLIAGIVGRT